jgi:hypothetical protein
MKIRTNRHARNLLCWFDLTPAEQKEVDYLAPDEQHQYRFVRYHRVVYDTYEFDNVRDTRVACTTTAPFAGWDGYRSETFFNGLLVRFDNDDAESVVVGSYFV